MVTFREPADREYTPERRERIFATGASAPAKPELLLRPPDPPRAVIGDAEMRLQRRVVGGQRRAVGGMDHAAALENNGVIGDAENFFGVLLDQDRRHALVAQ